VERPSEIAGAGRPSSVPRDYVVTPHGYFHPSCVVELQDQERLRADGSIVRQDGTSRRVVPCGHPIFDSQGVRKETAAPPPTVNGWVGFAASTATGATSTLAATWTVPSLPKYRTNQTIYFFPGLEPTATYSFILQPVLAWNGFGDRKWSIASWNCCKDGNSLHSPMKPVNPGETVNGSIIGTDCDENGVCSSWSVATSVPSRGVSTVLDTDAYGEVLDWTAGGALEAFNVTRCEQYPASGSFQFRNITVTDASGAPATPTWGTYAYPNSPNCLTQVSAPNAQTISLTWRTSGL
jgi:hypothetical protein